jgi:hypothetical protein
MRPSVRANGDGRRVEVEIGTERPAYVLEPLEDPVPTEEPAEEHELDPEPVEVEP